MTEALQRKILSHYRQLENNFDLSRFQDRVVYVSPVNFRESMSIPRHRWFPYKEGFSPSFVTQFISQYKSGNSGIILDPFCGVGTTPIVAGLEGLPSIGFDVNPLAVFVAKTKAINGSEFSESELLKTLDEFNCSEFRHKAPLPANKTVVNYFEESYLDALLKVKYFVSLVDNHLIRDLFKLALLSIVERFSTHRKTGNGVKKKTKLNYGSKYLTPLEEIKISIIELLRNYIADLRVGDITVTPQFSQSSGIEIDSYDSIDEISTILTSPPYANCFDYSKIYLQELWLGDFFTIAEDQQSFRKASIRSHVHATWSERHSEEGLPIVDNEIRDHLTAQKLWSHKIADMLSGYFKDLGYMLRLVKPKLTDNAVIGIVISNSFYGGIPIATDLLLGELGLRMGFNVESIMIYRRTIPSSQQYKQINEKEYMRESLVLLRNCNF